MHRCISVYYQVVTLIQSDPVYEHASESLFKEYSQKLLQAISLDSIIKQCNTCVQEKSVLFNKTCFISQMTVGPSLVKSINIIHIQRISFYYA